MYQGKITHIIPVIREFHRNEASSQNFNICILAICTFFLYRFLPTVHVSLNIVEEEIFLENDDDLHSPIECNEVISDQSFAATAYLCMYKYINLEIYMVPKGILSSC